jgi:hypothetical protein
MVHFGADPHIKAKILHRIHDKIPRTDRPQDSRRMTRDERERYRSGCNFLHPCEASPKSTVTA